MKKLNQFMSFDWAAFAKDKRFLCTGGGEWVDYATKEHRGTKIEVVIAVDNTEYRRVEGEVVSNRFEKLAIKVSDDIDIPVDQYVMPTGWSPRYTATTAISSPLRRAASPSFPIRAR